MGKIEITNTWERDGVYYVGWRDESGKLHWKSSRCRTKAALNEYIANFNNNRVEPASITISKLGELISERLNGVISPGTLRNYKDSLSSFQAIVGNKSLGEITTDNVETFKQRRLKNVEPGTVNRDLRNLKSVWSRAKKNYKLVSENPFSGTEMLANPAEDTEVAFMTEEELVKFLTKVEDKTLRDIYLVLGYTGLRVSELLQLQPEDVDLLAGPLGAIAIRTDEEFKPKTAKSNRRIPIAAQVRRVLEERLKEGHKLVFCKSGGFPLNRSWVSVRFKGYAKEAGLNQKLTLHGLRHTFVSMAIMKGVPLTTLQRWLGHANLDMINKVYSHITDQHSQIQMSKLSTHEETEQAIKQFDAEQARLFVGKMSSEESAKWSEKRTK